MNTELEYNEIKIYDNVFTKNTAFNIVKVLRQIKRTGQKTHGFFFRNDIINGNFSNPLEFFINDILNKINDNSNMVEYWFRLTWMDMRCHQDVNEAIFKKENRIIIPNSGNILYLSEMNDEAATLIFDKNFTNVTLIHPKIGRYVRFQGDAFHYVPSPFNSIFGEDLEQAKKYRIAILFNTWNEYIPDINEKSPKLKFSIQLYSNIFENWNMCEIVRYFTIKKEFTTIRIKFMGNKIRRLGKENQEYYKINPIIKIVGSISDIFKYEIEKIRDRKNT